MAVLEIQGNGESSYVPQEAINNAIHLLEDPLQRVRSIEGGGSLGAGGGGGFAEGQGQRAPPLPSLPGIHSEVPGAAAQPAPHSPRAPLPPGPV